MAKLQLPEDLLLYYGETCPYCRKVREVMGELQIDIPLKDTWHSEQTMEELKEAGGRYTVPCLRIKSSDGDMRYLYESNAIIQYLNERFANR